MLTHIYHMVNAKKQNKTKQNKKTYRASFEAGIWITSFFQNNISVLIPAICYIFAEKCD